jgi:hypothetical protein
MAWLRADKQRSTLGLACFGLARLRLSPGFENFHGLEAVGSLEETAASRR